MTYGAIVEKGNPFGGSGGRFVMGQVACGTSTTNGTIALSSYFDTAVNFVIVVMNGVTAKQVNAVTWTGTTVTVANDAPLASVTLDFIAYGY